MECDDLMLTFLNQYHARCQSFLQYPQIFQMQLLVDLRIECWYDLFYNINFMNLLIVLNFINTLYFAINYRFHRTFFRSQSIVRSFLALHQATPCCLVEPKDLLSKMRPSNTSCKWFSMLQSEIWDRNIPLLYEKRNKMFCPSAMNQLVLVLRQR